MLVVACHDKPERAFAMSAVRAKFVPLVDPVLLHGLRVLAKSEGCQVQALVDEGTKAWPIFSKNTTRPRPRLAPM